MSCLTIRNLTYTYPDGTRALDSVSLDVPDGTRLGIVGPNGAGKSTLISHLNGYLLPQSGSVEMHHIILSKSTRDVFRKAVGVVFQVTDNQLFMPRVYDDIVFGPQNLGLPADEVARRATEVMADLDIADLKDKSPFHLSQGEKRFAAMATVLVMEPKVLVLDEPTSDLDPGNRRRLIALIKRLPDTMMIVSHDLDFVWDTCDRTAVIKDGRVVTVGLTREVLSSEKVLGDAGLGLPLRLQYAAMQDPPVHAPIPHQHHEH
jgi:cobalt/nickel transport system ATP-binding protein